MAKVITQLDMMEYKGMDRAVFQKDTVITPSARDWAKEQNIRIFLQDCCDGKRGKNDDVEKAEFLNKTIRSFAQRFKEKGIELNRENLVEAVIEGCKRMGCTIEN